MSIETGDWVAIRPEDKDRHSTVWVKPVEIGGEVGSVIVAGSAFGCLDTEKMVIMGVDQLRRALAEVDRVVGRPNVTSLEDRVMRLESALLWSLNPDVRKNFSPYHHEGLVVALLGLTEEEHAERQAMWAEAKL